MLISLKIGKDNALTLPTTACTSVPGPDVPSWFGYFTRRHYSSKKTRQRLLSYIDALFIQGDILVAQDGQTRLGDFGITGAFRDLTYYDYKLEVLRYMAPERLSEAPMINGPSKKGDVYSLAMNSFEVFFSAINHPTT